MRLAARSWTSGPSTGTPPATAASYRSAMPAARAFSSRSGPDAARSALFAVTTRLPAAMAASMAARASSVPPMSSTTTSTPASAASAARSSVRRTLGGSSMPRGRSGSRTPTATSTGGVTPRLATFARHAIEQTLGHGTADAAKPEQRDTQRFAGNRLGIHVADCMGPGRHGRGPASDCRLPLVDSAAVSTATATPGRPRPRRPGRERVFSGVQPSGLPHIGNYLGAFRNYIAMQETHDAIYCIVDYHALTSTHDGELIRAEHLRDGARPAGAGAGSRALGPLPPVGSPGAHRALLAAGLGGAGPLGRAHADLQGEEAQPAGRRELRAARLSRAPGRRHRDLQGDATCRSARTRTRTWSWRARSCVPSTAATATSSRSRRRSTPSRP